MSFILVIMVFGVVSTTTSQPTITTVEFMDLEACVQASVVVKEMALRYGSNGNKHLETKCLPKRSVRQ